jgi:hypothetical protein
MTPGAGLMPVLRFMALCEASVTDLARGGRSSLLGLLFDVRAEGEPRFPFAMPVFYAFLAVTGARIPGSGQVVAVEAESDDVVFRTPIYPLDLGRDPVPVARLTLRVRGCVFPHPGFYWVQVWYNENLLAQQLLEVR